jgi:hypothetical protein
MSGFWLALKEPGLCVGVAHTPYNAPNSPVCARSQPYTKKRTCLGPHPLRTDLRDYAGLPTLCQRSEIQTSGHRRSSSLQARLGHASITTTLNTYGHLMPSAFEGVGERLEVLIKATPRQQARRNVKRGPQPSAETRVLTGS